MKNQALKWIAILSLLAAPVVFGQTLNTNGNFEGGWTTVIPGGSTPAQGKPTTGWTTTYTNGVGIYSVDGGSAALMIGSAANTGTSSGNLNTSPNFTSPPTSFVAKFDVALGAGTTTNSAAGTGNSRLFQMYLNNGAGQLTNLIITQGTTANTANVSIYSGGWLALSTVDALTTSGAYNYATNSFANALTFYTFTLTVHDFTMTGSDTVGNALSYDISCDLRGGGNVFNATGLTGVFGTPNATGLNGISFTSGFAGATTGTSFLVDNVSVVPEPTAFALALGGLLLLGGRFIRRKTVLM